MLTKDQLKKLKPLTKHKTFGPLLKAAIVGWKKCRPVQGGYGLLEHGGKWKRDSRVEGCCLVAASLLGRKCKNCYIDDDVEERFSLTFNQVYGLVNGFDGRRIRDEAQKFADEVALIVLSKE